MTREKLDVSRRDPRLAPRRLNSLVVLEATLQPDRAELGTPDFSEIVSVAIRASGSTAVVLFVLHRDSRPWLVAAPDLFGATAENGSPVSRVRAAVARILAANPAVAVDEQTREFLQGAEAAPVSDLVAFSTALMAPAGSKAVTAAVRSASRAGGPDSQRPSGVTATYTVAGSLPEIRGVAGWLLLFVLLSLGGLGLSASMLNDTVQAYREAYGAALAIPGLGSLVLVEAVAEALRFVGLLLIVFAIWQRQRWVVQFGQVYFGALALFTLIDAGILATLLPAAAYSDVFTPKQLGQTLGAAAGAGICFRYWQVSKRVRNTFGRQPRPPRHPEVLLAYLLPVVSVALVACVWYEMREQHEALRDLNDPNVVRLGLQPTQWGPTRALELGSKASDVVAGAGGRFLFFHLAEQAQVMVLDLKDGKLREPLRLPPGVVYIAADQNRLFAIGEHRGVQRWSLPEFEDLGTGTLPIEPRIVAASSGHNSVGPLVVLSEGREFFFIDPMMLWLLSRSKPVLDWQQNRLDFRVAGNGSLVTVWRGSGGSRLYFFGFAEEKPSQMHEHGFGTYLLPSYLGDTLFTSTGRVYHLLGQQTEQREGRVIPAITGDLYLSLKPPPLGASSPNRLQIWRPDHAQPLLELSDLPELAVPASWVATETVPSEKRVMLASDYGFLATLAGSDDLVVLRRIEVH